MKKMKKLIALLTAMVMVLGLSISVSAATITVENNDPEADTNTAGETYEAYKIFDAVRAEGTTVTTNGTVQTADGPIAYEIAKASPWFSVLFNEDGTAKEAAQVWFTAEKIEGEDPETWQVLPTETAKNLTDAKDIAEWLLEKKPASAEKISLNAPAKGQSAVSTDVADGYYLVTSSLGTNLGLATTDIPMTIVEKNTYPSVDKSQNDTAADAAYADTKVNVGIGDTIYYKVSAVIPATAKGTVTLTDTMSEGLTPAAASTITAKIGTEDLAASGSWEAVDGPSPASYTITITVNEKTLGKTVDFYMTATVNKDALTDTDRKNEVTLTYSNYSQSDYVEYTTYASGAVKYDGSTADNNGGVLTPKAGKEIKYLEGAEFKLQADGADVDVVKDGDYYRPALEGETGEAIVSDAKGQIIIRGLDSEKSYTLVETKAPRGYNPSANTASLTTVEDAKTNVSIDEGSDADTTYLTPAQVVKIENNQGSILPSTGGRGTAVFYILGSILVIGAGVILVTRRRMDV